MEAKGLIALVASAFALAACAPMSKHSVLSAVGPALSDPPEIHGIKHGSPAEGQLRIGDRVVAVDDRPVSTLSGTLTEIGRTRPQTFTIERGGQRVTLPFDVWFPASGEPNAFFLADNESYTVEDKLVAGGTARGAFLYSEKIATGVFVTRWSTAPNILEVQIKLQVRDNCTDCKLRDIGVMDITRRATLSAVNIQKAAFAVVPDLGAPSQPIAVPPPTVVGSVASTTMTGNVTAQTYGNTTRGTIYGQSNTVSTPIYDYSAQYGALGHNLGVAIRNSQIESANAARSKFNTDRLGNLRAGKLNPGEYVTGHLFFAAPAGFDGPYAVVIASGDEDYGYALFSNRARQ